MGFLPDEFLDEVQHTQDGGDADAEILRSSGRESVERGEDGEDRQDREKGQGDLLRGPAGLGSEGGGVLEGPEGRETVSEKPLTQVVSISHESGKPPGVMFSVENEVAQDLVVRRLAGFVQRLTGE